MNALLDPWRRTIAMAAMLVIAGFAAIAVAWVGVSATVSIPAQVAFAVSGGIGGFALAGTGLALLEVQRRRYDAAEARRDLAAFSAELGDIAELLAQRRRAPAPAPAPRLRRRVLRAR